MHIHKLTPKWLTGCLLASCLLASCLLVGALATGCKPAPAPVNAPVATDASNASKDAADKPMRVTPLKLQRKSLTRSIELAGRTEAFEVAPLVANVTGYVSKVSVDIGDRVVGPSGDKPGTLLCEVVVPELLEQLEEKKAAVVQCQAHIAQSESAVKLAEARAVSAAAHSTEIRAAAAGDEAQVARWKSEYDRVQQLVSSGVVTPKVGDETKAQYSTATALQQQTNAKITAAEAGVSEAQAGLDKAKADVAVEQAKLSIAIAEQRRVEALVAYTKMHAPFDGIIVDRRVHTGHLVHAAGDTPLVTVMRLDPIRVVLDIPESDAVLINGATQVELRAPSLPLQSYTGALTRSSWSLDNNSRTLKAEVDLPNGDGRWRPGMYLQAKLKVAERPAALAVPKTAHFMQDKQSYCFVVGDDGRLERRAVTLGIQAAGEIEVIDGLSEGQSIIAANPGAFRDGQIVEIAK